MGRWDVSKRQRQRGQERARANGRAKMSHPPLSEPKVLFTADEAGGHSLIRDTLPEERREIEPPQVRQRLGAPPLHSDIIQIR